MKTTVTILAVLSGLMLVCTMICGLWMRAQEEVEASSVNFHLGMAVLTAVLVLATLTVSIREMA